MLLGRYWFCEKFQFEALVISCRLEIICRFPIRKIHILSILSLATRRDSRKFAASTSIPIGSSLKQVILLLGPQHLPQSECSNKRPVHRLKNILPLKTNESLYRSFILPHFYHCNQVWHHCGKRNTTKIEKKSTKGR